MQTPTTLDQLSLNQNAEIVGIDWGAISDAEGRRLRALGIDEGVSLEKLHQGMFGLKDPIALKVGRMMIAVRKAHAQAISVQPVAASIAA
ncbi:FeoA family protein [Sphingorhabdus sp. 109]|jgi:ferrous iron transport protein A|uniref:FeoA family protein n=1 Tax=Sphingorhabdus sp. 109 TaxID=2653173 RepID=UPI0012EFC92B|nr:FeoA family protein [Sphingorhabdus sp. 109]VWX59039.1 Iron transporter FeoA [Sphingorhabdus sp. 109]